MSLTLVIGNKNYSSWSMRAWLVLKQANLAFTEQRVRFDSFDAQSQFKQSLLAINPIGKVPVLLDSSLGPDTAIWDTLAICEYLAERYPDSQLWPADTADRARARSLCAEMHAGFGALRSLCPMNIEAVLPDVGARLWRDNAHLRDDVQRLISLWRHQFLRSGGPLLFGNFTIADAYFAPVCLRLSTYALPLPDDVQAYVTHVLALPSVVAWVSAALAELDFLPFEEPYRTRASPAPSVA
jgi:glutathione S-transferase